MVGVSGGGLGRKVLLAVGKNMCPEINGALLLLGGSPCAALRNALLCTHVLLLLRLLLYYYTILLYGFKLIALFILKSLDGCKCI